MNVEEISSMVSRFLEFDTLSVVDALRIRLTV